MEGRASPCVSGSFTEACGGSASNIPINSNSFPGCLGLQAFMQW